MNRCVVIDAPDWRSCGRAMGDERAHALRLCNSQCLSVVAYPAFGVELVRITRDFAKQAQRVGRGARLAPRGLDGAITEFPRLVLDGAVHI